MTFRRTALLPAALMLLAAGCETADPRSEQALQYRRMELAAEAPGDYYVGRRFHIPNTHFWGYLRRPGQSWDSARLVVMSERFVKTPDRLPEIPSGDGPAYGSDHNREYRIWGSYSGRKVYDPNSNMVLPEFVLQRYEVKSYSPGWLFKPGERFNGQQLLRAEPGSTP